MAKKFALVPETWLNKEAESSTAPVLSNDDTPKLSTLADILPKYLRSRARIILHYLEGKVALNDMQRIVYSNGVVGSHVVDLIRYAISPFVKSRPLDWPEFQSLMERLGVPSSILAKRTEVSKNDEHQSILDEWLTY